MERRKSNKITKILAVVTAFSSFIILVLMVQTLTRSINYFLGALLSFVFLLIIASANLTTKLVSRRKAEKKNIPLAIISVVFIGLALIFSFINFYHYV